MSKEEIKTPFYCPHCEKQSYKTLLALVTDTANGVFVKCRRCKNEIEITNRAKEPTP